MFIAALFTIAMLWKQPRSPVPMNGLRKTWYLYTLGFYSATKKKEILSFTSKWMELENVILSKVTQAQKAKNHMFSLIWGLWTPNKCSNIMGHTLMGEHAQRNRERKRNLKLGCG
jgi:hypothetical protein